MKTAPYGSWRSPITSDSIVSGTVGLGQIAIDGEDVYWVETRPTEKGRYTIVKLRPGGVRVDITPPHFNVRTRVHEYGGGSFVVSGGTIIFSNFMDQRLHLQTDGSQAQAITPPAELRYADGVMDFKRNRIICVREDHTIAGAEAANTIAGIDLNGELDQQVLASGDDFYSSPRLSPDGSRLAWLSWNHPNMPWDGSKLWVADVSEDGSLANKSLIAGGIEESIFQPEWSPDGILHFVSDRTGWWNLYCFSAGRIEPLCEMDVEFGLPQWGFGMSTYAFASAGKIIGTYVKNGFSHLAILETATGRLETIESPYTRIEGIKCSTLKPGRALFVAGSPHESSSIVEFDLTTRRFETLRRSSDLAIDAGYISIPRALEFPTEGGMTAHAFFYAPANRDFASPEGELPPLLVMSHGGPTAAASATFRLSIQYWTSRGFAVLDVNYGGSTGYGRSYRERLRGNWGVTDVDDCVNGAKYLADLGQVDMNRLAITGGSAGGYTTLCALTFRDVFSAGASYYGVSDLEALEVDTHKFESRYSHSLVGPYPERADLYRQRSPIHFTDQLKVPVIFFQGLEDKIVPPNQAEMMVEALRAKNLPVAYIAFEGEQHGFRQAANIKRSLDGEFYFYARVFGFEPADSIEPVDILNL
jgi:dipeptidyl aminopeptidase/acylaminoacyl peptidase